MNNIPFEHFLAGLSTFKYLFAFVLAIVEGPMVMVASGILYRLGFFSLLPIYFSLMLGDFAADLGWYAVGRFGALKFVNRWGHYFSLTPDVVEKLEKTFERHHDKILFISKITMGFGFALATLIAAGMARVPFKKYALYNFLGGFIWTGLLMALGYFFGHLYTLLDKSFRLAFIIFLIAAVMAAIYGGGKYFKKQFLKANL